MSSSVFTTIPAPRLATVLGAKSNTLHKTASTRLVVSAAGVTAEARGLKAGEESVIGLVVGSNPPWGQREIRRSGRCLSPSLTTTTEDP